MCKLRVADVLLFLFLLMLTGAIMLMGRSQEASAVNIKTPTHKFRYLLGKNRIVSIPNMIIAISNGSVFVKKTSCPHNICQRMGPIKHAGEVIICVPSKIEIKIVGAARKADVICH